MGEAPRREAVSRPRPVSGAARRKLADFAPPDPDAARRLAGRYDRPGPRYTSYPTAPIWNSDFGPEDFQRALGRLGREPVSLYVHVPFCERLCTYCACNRVVTRDHGVAAPYLDDLAREVEAVASAIGARVPSAQLAIGGGTPTFLEPEELARLLDIVDAAFPPEPGAERSIEVDPRVTTRAQLAFLAERGFNRVSLGVQDLSPRVQEAIRRIQPIEQTLRTAQDARELGFGSLNFDLIYGLPYQTTASFADTIDQVVALAPDRIALYSYAHVTWVSKQQRGFEKGDLPGPEAKLAIFGMAIRKLTEAGYLFLGMDHFARPDDALARAARDGTLHRNFMGYTTQRSRELIGLGASAISTLDGAYAQNERALEAWQGPLREGRLATARGWWLSEDDRRRAWLIRRLLCDGALDPGAYAAAFGEDLAARVPDYPARLAPFVEDGLLDESGGTFRVTPLGRLFLRPIAMTFDAHLAPGDAEGGRYSRTV